MTPETLVRFRKLALLVNLALFAFAIYLILTDNPAGWENLAIPSAMLVILVITGRRRQP
ncbi:MAG TPA: hypothetical protein HPQ04_05300 [Rhodospirillaceae bacterium]|nr:hypothetical protein [Rhodospirillaceae bacterium]